ncbi:auxilin-like protein 1 [Beta vulgaris subsp. vulgaris]|uniref:auxilin-like protein 1 n=1 Tax=Beta vulgaris subsp. vulgaris TaxID=3555 RepID=UPI002036B57B|nr:auxilin-like protein 1 [Beta vulgaris subsp. vulgaris]XP_057251618.1 auxilin-like protein 1 [Beta vulgaris subsp. vulgaris]XP_057251619.1 auxilin-like protein 1 [Beta vulgaris subsp. vulgaris]XP_057251620.1 auxilin-like protein 1 [Beta vulgaris subsp. vulgaris]XP_057251621.1 auxilin-like protein 1 [Beta vulgaris subsp. vulgaris]XP_057251622.1 auxilin-like protein 1 [Beta vulgaris subsp. vulgaris]
MAEVKQQNGLFSLSTKKKPPSFSNNGVSSSSFKHIYDDVFASPVQSKLESSISFMDDDYAEIFGSSKSNNGCWNIPYSSIPILDLPPKEKGVDNRRGGERMDYGGVFGVVNGDSFGLSDGEELFDQLKKKVKTSSPPNLPRSREQTTEASSIEISSQSFDGHSPTNGFSQSSNNKQFEPGNNKVTVNTTGGPRKAAHVRAYSLHEVSAAKKTVPDQTPVTKDDRLDAGSNLEKKQGKHARHASLVLDANKQNSNCDAALQKVSVMSGTILVDTSEGTCQSSSAATNELCQSFGNTKHSKYDMNEMSFNRTIEATKAADVEPIHEANRTLHELGPTQNTLSSRASVFNDATKPGIDVNLGKEQRKHPHTTSLDLGANTQSDEYDPNFPKACGLTESTSVNSIQRTCQATFVAGPSNVVKDDAEISIGYDEVKKTGRHSRMTSLDLGDHKHSRKRDDGLKRKPRIGGSYSFDASHDHCAARVKVQPYKMDLSSSLPRFLADELDVNSAAAVSAAALQRAIEEAEMRIRFAKAFLEREAQGSSNLRFKDTLKVNVAKQNVLANEIDKSKETKVHECSPPIGSEIKASNFRLNDTLKVKLAKQNVLVNEIDKFKQTKVNECSPPINSEMKPCSPIERNSVVETGQEAPVDEDQMKFVTDGEIYERNSDNASNSMRGDDKCEEVEWEAAKHFNQLLSGVKNKLASFMSWQTETEKKEESEEMEAIMKLQQQAEEVESDVKYHEFFNETRTEKNQGTATSSGDMHVVNKIQLASEVVDPEEDEPIRSFNVKQDKSGNGIKFIPYTEGPISANFQFFAFRNQKFTDSLDPEVDEKKGAQGSRESEIESGQEQVVNEANNETVPCQSERQDDMLTIDIGSCDGENEKIVEEPCSLARHKMVEEPCCIQAGYESNDVVHEEDNDRKPSEDLREESVDHSHECEIVRERTDDGGENAVLKEARNQHENVETVEEIDVVGETWKNFEASEDVNRCMVNERVPKETNHIEEVSGQTYEWEDCSMTWNPTDQTVETAYKEIVEANCIASDEEECKEMEDIISSNTGEGCKVVEKSSKDEELVSPDEEIERMVDIADISSEPEMDVECPVFAQETSEFVAELHPALAQKASDLIGAESVLSSVLAESTMELGGNGIKEGLNSTDGSLPQEYFFSPDSRTEISSENRKTDPEVVKSETQDHLENQTDHLHESGENLHIEEFDTEIDQDAERSGVEAVHRRRRWFDNSGSIMTAERPSILEGNQIDLEIDQEVLDESELAGSVEIHADKLDNSATEVRTATDADTSSNGGSSRINVETTPTRRKWFVNRGEEGVHEPVSLFEGIKVDLEVPLESMNELLLHNISSNRIDKLATKSEESLHTVKSDVLINEEQGKQSGEAVPRRRRWFESGERVGSGQKVRINEDVGLTVEVDQDTKAKEDTEKHGKIGSMSIPPEKDAVHNKMEPVKELHSDLDELNRREKEKEKEKLAVERAIREARERAFAEARGRARRDAAERPNVEARPRVVAGVQEKLGKVSSEAFSSIDKASMEAKLKAERAAVERATAEARERALQKALTEKASHRSREQVGRSSEKNSSLEPKHQSSRSSDSSNNSEKFDGDDVESSQRRKARLERQKRTVERAANALEEKNMRDLLAQKEEAAKNMLADSLHAEVKRWSSGKEGNLRSMLSTLQYILGPDSGWEPISLNDLVAATAVRKAYKKATLCVHPDKLQQRGATIQQKYICEKVFDLLKEAWSKFNPDER